MHKGPGFPSSLVLETHVLLAAGLRSVLNLWDISFGCLRCQRVVLVFSCSAFFCALFVPLVGLKGVIKRRLLLRQTHLGQSILRAPFEVGWENRLNPWFDTPIWVAPVF